MCIPLIALQVLFAPGRILAQEPPFSLPAQRELAKLRTAILYTDKGSLIFELFPDQAPWHVANFKYLADKGFYRGLAFHRFEAGYFIQGGAPTTDPNSGPGYSLPSEVNRRSHVLGVLGMARSPDTLNPERESHGSQFLILLGEAPHMDGSYTVFGKLIAGEDTLQRLRKGDRIKDLKVFVRAGSEF